MRRSAGVAAILIGLALAGQPATAGTAADAPASSASEREQDVLVRAFIRDHTIEAPSRRIARWLDPVCPQASGLSDAVNASVTQRVREVAAAAGIRVAEGPCTPDLVVTFTDEPQAFLDVVRKEAPHALGYHFLTDRTKVSRVTLPAQAWYGTVTENMNGRREADSADDPSGYEGFRAPSPGVRLSNRSSSGVVSALVVIDTKAIDGVDVGALGDYAALVGLAQIGLSNRCKPTPSIANLMNPGCPPERKPKGMTEADLAYLKALYKSNPVLFADGQRNNIAFHMKEALKKEP